MAYYANGSITTGKRSIGVSDTWETQEDWEAYQSINQVEITSGTVLLGSFSFPDDEDFSHNDLSANYVGDLSGYIIDEFSGVYRLKSDSPTGDVTIVRDSEDWERYSVRMQWEQYMGQTFTEGGVILGATKSGWGSSLDGYRMYTSLAGDNIYIDRIDGGGVTNLFTDNDGPGGGGGEWIQCQVDMLSDGTLEYHYGNYVISATDQTYDRVNLGFYTNDEDPPVYFRNVTFSTI